MSAKGRRRADGSEAEKPERNNYPTPAWAVRAIIAGLWPEIADPRRREDPSKPLVICDPCCGDGAFLGELAHLTRDWPLRRRPALVGMDIRPEAVAACAAEVGRAGAFEGGRFDDVVRIVEGNFLGEWSESLPRPDAFITNPPYGPRNSDLAARFVRQSLDIVQPGGHVVMLLRLNWISDGEGKFDRATWLRDGNMPDLHILDRRPSFVGGGTDSCGYAAMHWIKGRRQSEGAVRILRCRDPFVLPMLQAQGFSTDHITPEAPRQRRSRAHEATTVQV